MQSSNKLPPDFTIVVDVDGTLCPIKQDGESYADLAPNTAIVSQLKAYKHAGAKIVLYTSRGMRTYQGNLELIRENILPTLSAWLKEHDVPFDDIQLGKPWPGANGFFIDDRAVRPNEFANKSAEELLELTQNSSFRVGDNL